MQFSGVAASGTGAPSSAGACFSGAGAGLSLPPQPASASTSTTARVERRASRRECLSAQPILDGAQLVVERLAGPVVALVELEHV